MCPDDFTKFGDAPTTSGALDAFVKSNQIGDASCTEDFSYGTCGSDKSEGSRYDQAVTRCEIPMRHSAFRASIMAQIEPAMYTQACIHDFCKLPADATEAAKDAVVCHYLSAFALISSQNGIRLGDWREEVGICRESSFI